MRIVCQTIKRVLKMKTIRKCRFCGKEFVARNGMQKFCCEECQTMAEKARKKRQQDFMNAVEPVIGLQCQEYLTFSKAALLMGCSRQYVYKLVNEGKLAASRISSRMAFIRKADIEKMLAGNPYHRVLPTSRSKKSVVPTTKKGKATTNSVENRQAEEVLDYISGEEVMETYKVRKSWLYASAKRHQVPVCRIAGRNYYSYVKQMNLLIHQWDVASVNTLGAIDDGTGKWATGYQQALPDLQPRRLRIHQDGWQQPSRGAEPAEGSLYHRLLGLRQRERASGEDLRR